MPSGSVGCDCQPTLEVFYATAILGAAIIDVGGKATNPNINLDCNPLSVQEEINRVIPVITAVVQRFEQ